MRFFCRIMPTSEVLSLERSQYLRICMRVLLLSVGLFLLVTMVGYFLQNQYYEVVALERKKTETLAHRLGHGIQTRTLALELLATDVEVRSMKPEALKEELERPMRLLGLLNVAMFDLQGNIVTQIDPICPRKKAHDQESFQKALTGQTVASDLILCHKAKHPYISLRVPVYATPSQMVGVLAGGVKLDDLALMLNANKDMADFLQEGRYVIVRDKQGHSLYHSRKGGPDLEGSFAREASLKFNDLQDGQWLDRSVPDAEDIMYFYTTMDSTGWKVIYAVPANRLYTAVVWNSLPQIVFWTMMLLCSGLLYRNLRQAQSYEDNMRSLRLERLVSVNQLAAGLAHEVRNPLTSVKGFIQLLGMRKEAPPDPEYLEIILAEIDRIDRLIGEFQRLTKPLKSPQFVRLPLEKLIHDVMLLMETQALSQQIELTFFNRGQYNVVDAYALQDMLRYQSDMEVVGDEAQLKQVFINLIKNAFEAVKGRTGRVEVLLSRDHDMLKVIVRDNGVGMSPELVSKIGTPFFTTKEQGNGLGLSVCYNIIDTHGGRMEVNSRVGEGTQFIVYLPCAK